MEKNRLSGEVIYAGSMHGEDKSINDLAWEALIPSENANLFTSIELENIRKFLISSENDSLWYALRTMLISQLEVFAIYKNELSELFSQNALQRKKVYELEAHIKFLEDIINEHARVDNYWRQKFETSRTDNILKTKKIEELGAKDFSMMIKGIELETTLDKYDKQLANAKARTEEISRLLKMAEAAIIERDEKIVLGREEYAELSEICDSLRDQNKDYRERLQTIELLNEASIKALEEEKQRSTTKQFELHRRLAAANARHQRQGLEVCPPKLRAMLLSLQPTCMMCGSDKHMTIDRRYAGRWGGRYWPTNCGPLCQSCNSRKGDSTDRKWWYWTWPEHQSFVDQCERIENEEFAQMHMTFVDDETEYIWGDEMKEDEDGEEPMGLSNP